MAMIYQKTITAQNGSALIVSLVILLVMTIIGITGMKTTVLEEKMANNFRDKDVAFQAAESALRVVEMISKNISGHTGMTVNCANGLCYVSPDGHKAAEIEEQFAAGHAVPINLNIPDVSQQPQYLVDGVKSWVPGGAGWKYMYRITVQATGNLSSTQSELRSAYYPNN